MSSSQVKITSEPMVLPDSIKKLFRKRVRTRAPMPPRLYHFVVPEIVPEESPPQPDNQVDGGNVDRGTASETGDTSPEIPLQCDVSWQEQPQRDEMENEEDKENRNNISVKNTLRQDNGQNTQHQERKSNNRDKKKTLKKVEPSRVHGEVQKKKKDTSLKTKKRKQREADGNDISTHDVSREPRIKRACVESRRRHLHQDPPKVTPTSSQPISKKLLSGEAGRVLFQTESSQPDLSQDYTMVSTPRAVNTSGTHREGEAPRRSKRNKQRSEAQSEPEDNTEGNGSTGPERDVNRGRGKGRSGARAQEEEEEQAPYRLWQGEGDDFVRRSARSVTDLDVMLNHFEEFALEYRNSVEDPALRKVVNRVAREVQGEARKTILKVVTYEAKLKKLRQSERLLKKKRDELCDLQHERQVKRRKLLQLRKTRARAERPRSSAEST